MTEYSANNQQTTTETLEDLYTEHFLAGETADDLSAEELAHPEGVEVRYLHSSYNNASAASDDLDDGLDCVAGDADDRGDGLFELADEVDPSGLASFSRSVTLRTVNSCAFSADEAAELLAEAGLIPLDEEDPASLAEARDAVEGVAELLAGADATVSELIRALCTRGFALVEEGMSGVWIPVAASPGGAAAGVVFGYDGTVRASVLAHFCATGGEESPVPTPEEDELVDDLRDRNGGMLLDGALRAHDPEAILAVLGRGELKVLADPDGLGADPVVVLSGFSTAAAFELARTHRSARWEAAEFYGGRRDRARIAARISRRTGRPMGLGVQGKLWDAAERGGFAEEVATGRGLGRERHDHASGEGGPIAGLSDEGLRAMDAAERARLMREQAAWVMGHRAALSSDPAAVAFAARTLRIGELEPAGAAFKASRFLDPLGPKGLDVGRIRRVALSRAVPAILRRGKGPEVPANLLALSVLVARTLTRQVLAAAGPNPYGSAAEGRRVAERAERRRRDAQPLAKPIVPAAGLDGLRNTPAKRRARRKEYLTGFFAEALKQRSASRIALDTARALYLGSLAEGAPAERVRLLLARSEGHVVARSCLKGLGLLDAARDLVTGGEASAKCRRSDGRVFLVASAALDREAVLGRYRRGVLAAIASPEGGIGYVPEGTRLSAAVAAHRLDGAEEARADGTNVAAELSVA